MDAKYGEAYRELFEKHWWWRSRNELIVDRLRELRSPDWKRVLDIGCGDALFFDRLAEFGEVEGVEPCPELVNPQNPHRNRIQICPFDVSFRPGKQYSLILMLDVLEHLQHPEAALRHALDLLLPSGLVILTVPAFKVLWTYHDDLNHHLTRYTKRSFRRIARQAGLEIREARYLYHWTWPVKLGVRALEGLAQTKSNPPRIPPSWANEALFRLSRFEQKTLSALPMPFGSSLLVVAGKAQA